MAPSRNPAPAPLSPDQKKRAILRLVLTILVIDTLAVIGYLILVHVLGFEGIFPFGLLLVVAVGTGMYFTAGRQRIGG